MKNFLNRFLLLFGKKHSRIQVEGSFRYRVDYKTLFGNEYIVYKSLPPIHFGGKSGPKLPFDSLSSRK